MALPDIRLNNIAQHLNNVDIVNQTAQQIMKDFGMFGVTINFSGNIENAYHELFDQLKYQISDLYSRDYGRLLSVLYQVDISPKDITKAHEEMVDYTLAEVISHQIIVRDLKKVLTRLYFKANQ
jgi:hypothetical protein